MNYYEYVRGTVLQAIMSRKTKQLYVISAVLVGIVLVSALFIGLVSGGIIGGKQVELTVSTGSNEALYDGTPLTNHNWSYSGQLKDGHQINVEFSGSQTNVGESRNTVEITVTDELGADVTSDYKIKYDLGTLKVTPRTVTVSSASDSKLYDGEPLTNKEYTVSYEDGGLVKGHNLKVHISGSITKVGIVPNTIKSVTITDEYGSDITMNYRVIYNTGLLEVKARNLIIVSSDASKVYDGEPLVCDEYVVADYSDELVKGNTLKVTIKGTITFPGVTPNTIGEVIVRDKMGNDVTLNYNITRKEGILLVEEPKSDTPMDATASDFEDGFGGGSGGGSGDGGSGGGGGGGGGGEIQDVVLYSVYAEVSGPMYLRMGSFGNYTGMGWMDAPQELFNDQQAVFYLTAGILEKMGGQSNAVTIKSYSSPYVIPYYISDRGNSTIVQNSDPSDPDVTAIYSYKYYNYDSRLLSYGNLNSAYEEAYREFVYQNYLHVDSETAAYMKNLIKEQRFTKEDSDIIKKVAVYIQNAATYNLNFDPELEKSKNVAIAFLEEYKEGVCRHYATAATLLFRTLGIPARYTVGAFAETVAGEWVDVKDDKMHAWVEVYIDGVGWIYVEVTGSLPDSNFSGELFPGAGGGMCDGTCEGECDGSCSGGGSGNGGNETYNKKKITLYPTTVRKQYDGTTLYAEPVISGFDELAKMGYFYYVTVEGERTEIGASDSKITYIDIFDSNGANVTENFDITLNKGRVHVYARVLTFRSDNYKLTYDGRTINHAELTSGQLFDGHRYEITSTANFTVGKHTNSYNVKVYDENGGDVTDHYYIKRSYGTLNIYAREITVKAGDLTKKYDGTPLECNEFEIISGYLADGHMISECVVVGSQTEIGRADNVISSISIVDAEGNDVTANYAINFVVGKLRVTAS